MKPVKNVEPTSAVPIFKVLNKCCFHVAVGRARSGITETRMDPLPPNHSPPPCCVCWGWGVGGHGEEGKEIQITPSPLLHMSGDMLPYPSTTTREREGEGEREIERKKGGWERGGIFYSSIQECSTEALLGPLFQEPQPIKHKKLSFSLRRQEVQAQRCCREIANCLVYFESILSVYMKCCSSFLAFHLVKAHFSKFVLY